VFLSAGLLFVNWLLINFLAETFFNANFVFFREEAYFLDLIIFSE